MPKHCLVLPLKWGYCPGIITKGIGPSGIITVASSPDIILEAIVCLLTVAQTQDSQSE